MKYFATIFTLLVIVFMSTNDSAYTFSTGAPSGKTGSPGDEGISCNSTYCHSGPCLLYTSPSPRDQRGSRMPSSA